jgi:replication factor C subunit 1
MRLRASGDRHEIRQQYLPALWNQLVRPLKDDGKDEVENVIELMDSYYLTRDDWDAIVELGLGPMDESKVKIAPATKSTFTRLYNGRSHPLPFMKASSIVAPKKTSREKPDLEEAIDESDDAEEISGENEVKEEDDEDLDLKKDKYVKVPKKKAPAAKKAAGKKGKKSAADDDEEGSEIEEKPKKGKGRAKGKAKA